MLDLLERLGFDFDGIDNGLSVKLHGFLFRNHKPQSLCAYLVHRGRRSLVRIIGVKHCLRSYDRYY
ncbi:hypothetical protein vBDshPR2C_83 [Dinoroseobacter phage vBDshPR2C]|uniref:Uncharacterized protein n=1 Tax=Dinoroseobacter phage vBDshPR2C TaxID=1498169 RepID=A0A0A7CI89_9CAUD|nr:hypothetical protein vBDshPR2C_83 [Dinoroseobacter phage vBDshPR2C]